MGFTTKEKHAKPREIFNEKILLNIKEKGDSKKE